MDPSTSSSAFSELILGQRNIFRSQLQAEEDEPIQPYENYARWLVEQENEAESSKDASAKSTVCLELLTVLEEGIRCLREETQYRDDLRYMKLCLAYAAHVEKPDYVYVFLLKSNIGSIHPQLYEDYAISLEQQGR